MFKYEGAQCPVCHAYLMEEDDIVVCPDCGAPHHRDCWAFKGHCGCEELHAQGKMWAPPSFKKEQQREEPRTQPCPACHAQNEPGALFCSKCGAPMQGASPFSQSAGPGAGGFYGGFQAVALDPLGGVAPEEEINGVKAKDLAQVVGQNSMYYIPRFREMAQGNKRFFPNFTALLFDIPWLFFRHMNWLGVAVILVEFALSLPTVWVVYQGVTAASLTEAAVSSQLLTVCSICSLLQSALRILIGIYGNKLYMNHCVKLAKELKETCESDEDFAAAAKKRGGVRTVSLYIWGGLMLLLYLAYSFFILRGITL